MDRLVVLNSYQEPFALPQQSGVFHARGGLYKVPSLASPSEVSETTNRFVSLSICSLLVYRVICNAILLGEIFNQFYLVERS